MSEQKGTVARRKSYKTDLTDEQWASIGPLLPPAVAKTGCQPTDLREVINTILYQNKTGCQWDMLPHDLTAKSTAFGYYTAWQNNGVWELLLDALRRNVRAATPRAPAGGVGSSPNPSPGEDGIADGGKPPGSRPIPAHRDETPSFAIPDSRPVKTTEVGGEQRGYDGGKEVKGRKRPIAVDTSGLLLAVAVTAANVSDGRGACQVLGQMSPEAFPRLKGVCGDGRYNDRNLLRCLGKRTLTLEVKSRPPGAKGFVLLKKRWVVERTFAWLGFHRRPSKDYERKVSGRESRVRIAAIGMMLRRLTKAS